MTFARLSAFSLASFEMQAQTGGTARYADAVYDLEDQISLSPQAMGLVGHFVSTSEVHHASPVEPDNHEPDDYELEDADDD